MEEVDEDTVRDLVETHGYSYADISRECQLLRPGMRGFSERSIRRYCKEHRISKTSQLDDVALDRIVHSSVSKVCRNMGKE